MIIINLGAKVSRHTDEQGIERTTIEHREIRQLRLRSRVYVVGFQRWGLKWCGWRLQIRGQGYSKVWFLDQLPRWLQRVVS